MKTTVTEHMFVEAITRDEYSSMSHEGAKALFQFLEECSEDSGNEIEFDKVAIRCDFSEYEDLAEVLAEYDSIQSLEELQENTCVIEIEGTDRLIIQVF